MNRPKLLISAAIMLTVNIRLVTVKVPPSYDESYFHDNRKITIDQPIFFPAPVYDFNNKETFFEFWNASHFRKYHKLMVRTDFTPGLRKLTNPPSMLLGIITESKAKDRRKVIRETYLNYYKDIGDTNSRICALKDIVSKVFTVEDCRLIYTFVAAGGTEDSPPNLLQKAPSTPMTVSGPVENSNENDVIYLNIRDNMNEGKIPTWFKYASHTMKEEYGLQFDYIAKIDDDTLLFTGNWMDIMERQLPKPYQVNVDGLVYGGFVNIPFKAWQGKCHEGQWEKCPLIGPLWMVGSFYFLSRELALYTTSDRLLDHESISFVEDVSTGSYVWSHPGNVTVVEIFRQHALMSYDFTLSWTHDKGAHRYLVAVIAHSEDACWNPTGPYFKQPGNVRKVWREYLAFIWSGKKIRFDSRYTLYDYAPSNLPAAPRSIHPSDYIFSGIDFDASPIVIGDPFNFVFFPITGVADVAWRCVIRRLLGYEDWSDPTRQFHGLTYLSNYTIEEATNIMYSPNYTRALFVRNPVKRIQSNYIKLVLHDPDNTMLQGCDCARRCASNNQGEKPCQAQTQSFKAFLQLLVRDCDQPYWRPQANRMEPRYYQLLDFIGRYALFALDAETLLQEVILKSHKTLDHFGWVDGSHLEEIFARFDESYNASDAAILFNSTWKAEFKSIFPNDRKSSIIQLLATKNATDKGKNKKKQTLKTKR